MKKIIFAAAAAMISVSVFAGGVENKTNLSTGNIRNPSRNTECERPEASFYNIAGTGFMTDGLYLEAGNQFVWKEYANTWATDALSSYKIENGAKSNDETTVKLYPNLDAVYKHDNFAVFANFGVYAGGGKLDFTEGTTATSALFLKVAQGLGAKAQAALSAGDSTTAAVLGKYSTNLGTAATNHALTVTSITFGGQLGAAYQINDMVALALAGRFCYGTQNMKLKSAAFALMGTNDSKVEYDADAMAFSGVVGVHVKPVSALDVAAQFATKSALKYKVNKVSGNTEVAEWCQITEGKKWNVDLAPTLNFGVGYHVIEPLYLSTSFNYYFNRWASMDSILAEGDYDDSWEVALGADYIINKYVTMSCGTQYGYQGIKDSSNNSFNPVLSSFQFAGGFEVHPVDALTVTTGLTHVHYLDADYYLESYKTVLSKNVWLMSLGVTYRFDM